MRIDHKLLLCSLFCMATAKGNPTDRTATSIIHINTERTLVTALEPVFSKAHVGVRINFESPCKTDKPNSLQIISLPFPNVDAAPTKVTQSAEAAIKHIFSNDESIAIYEKRDHLIYIKIGEPDFSILKTRLIDVKLAPSSQYTPALAIADILQDDSISRAETQSGFSLLPLPMDLQVVMPAPGLSHMPGELRDMTLDQALDLVAATFHGMVIYGSCKAWGVYDIRFVGEDP